MSRETKVELTNMCMLCDGEGRVLVQDKLHPEWPGLTFRLDAERFRAMQQMK